MSHLIITNRAPVNTAAGWIHIVPKGELENREAGLVQVLDDAALDSILNGLEADKARLGNRWPGLYFGEEHFIYNDNKSSVAWAWAKEFQKRDDGLWAKPEFTSPALAERIANKEFKFTSFVADRRDTEKLGGNKVRILKIETVGFTNQANGKELLTPIVNRDTFAGASAPAVNQNQQPKGLQMQNIAKKLGLAAEASEEAILAAIAKLMDQASSMQVEVGELKNRASALEKENATFLAGQVEADLVKYASQIKPESKEAVKAALLTNRAGTIALLEATIATPVAPKILNRASASTPSAKPAAAEDSAQAEKIVNRANVLVAGGMKFETAWNQARREAGAAK